MPAKRGAVRLATGNPFLTAAFTALETLPVYFPSVKKSIAAPAATPRPLCFLRPLPTLFLLTQILPPTFLFLPAFLFLPPADDFFNRPFANLLYPLGVLIMNTI